MGLESNTVTGIKVVNIVEENAEAIERMVNKAIAEIHQNKTKILDIQITGDNLIIILGEQEGKL